MIQPIILCGGKGSRLWPLSRELYPKQYIDFGTGKTLFQQTVQRAGSIPQVLPPLVVCNAEHRFFVAEQLRHLGVSGDIVLEPVGRNTAPAVTVGALMRKEDDPLLLVMPADHLLSGDVFQRVLPAAAELADAGYLVTFGIAPERPETGYGYLERGESLRGGYRVSQFAEKPSADVAEQFVASGRHFWNSGIFLFRASAYLEELGIHAPEMLVACEKALQQSSTDLDFIRLDERSFAECPENSIDYALMEKTSRCAMVVLEDAGWSDLGSWGALYSVGNKDGQGNVCRGDVLLENVQDSYVHAESRLVAVVGLKGVAVVETSDAVLIADMDRVQDVKVIATTLNREARDESLHHKKVYRPWGAYESTDKADRFQVKRITVNPGQRLSLQKHHHRAEHWVVVRGTAQITNGDKEFLLSEDQSTYIPVGAVHRLENPGCIPLELIEVQTGAYLGEDDIVRFDDVYGRKDS